MLWKFFCEKVGVIKILKVEEKGNLIDKLAWNLGIVKLFLLEGIVWFRNLNWLYYCIVEIFFLVERLIFGWSWVESEVVVVSSRVVSRSGFMIWCLVYW